MNKKNGSFLCTTQESVPRRDNYLFFYHINNNMHQQYNSDLIQKSLVLERAIFKFIILSSFNFNILIKQL